MKYITAIMLLFLSTFSIAQTKPQLEGKSFRAFITSMCVESNKSNPCAGHMDYMELHFKKDIVEVVTMRTKCSVEKPIATQVLKWTSISSSQIKIDQLRYERAPLLLDNNLKYQNKNLVGAPSSRFNSEFTFGPMKNKK